MAELCDKPNSTLRDMANKRGYSLTTEKGKTALMRLKQIGALPATTSGTVVIKASQVSRLLSEFNAPEKVQADFKIMRMKARPPPGLRVTQAGGERNISMAKTSPALPQGASDISRVKRVGAAPKLQRQGSAQHASKRRCTGEPPRAPAAFQGEEQQPRQQRAEGGEEEEEGEEEAGERLHKTQLPQSPREPVTGGGSPSEEEAESGSDQQLGMRRVGDCTPSPRIVAALARGSGAALRATVEQRSPNGAACSRWAQLSLEQCDGSVIECMRFLLIVEHRVTNVCVLTRASTQGCRVHNARRGDVQRRRSRRGCGIQARL